jgi:hypothetical protein
MSTFIVKLEGLLEIDEIDKHHAQRKENRLQRVSYSCQTQAPASRLPRLSGLWRQFGWVAAIQREFAAIADYRHSPVWMRNYHPLRACAKTQDFLTAFAPQPSYS